MLSSLHSFNNVKNFQKTFTKIIPYPQKYFIQIETTMDGDDKTMSTITATNDKEPCSDTVLNL